MSPLMTTVENSLIITIDSLQELVFVDSQTLNHAVKLSAVKIYSNVSTQIYSLCNMHFNTTLFIFSSRLFF